MIIFLYGPDSYRRGKRLGNILEEYKNKHSGFSRDVFDLSEEGEFERLKDFAGQMLIFDSKKMAVLKDAFDADPKLLRDFFKKYLDTKEITILISEEKAAPAELKTILSKSYLIEKFEELKGEKFKFFIQKEAREKGVNLSQQAAYFLADSFNGNILGAVNELEKLGLAFGNKEIKTADLFEVGDYRQSPNIFSFINSVAGGWNIPQKIAALEELFLAQEEPAKVFNFLAAGKRLQLDLLEKLADYDVAVKSGKLDYDEVLLDLALSG